MSGHSAIYHYYRLGDIIRIKALTKTLKTFREIPKKATNIALTPSPTTILVSDKFGDVFRWLVPGGLVARLLSCFPLSYPLQIDPGVLTREPKPKVAPELRREGVGSHENDIGTLVLGHSSMITSMKLCEDYKYIVTADRDEHIRISWYPEGYNIETFCLGHTKCLSFRRFLSLLSSPLRNCHDWILTVVVFVRYVSALCMLPFKGLSLVSAGGDAELHFWNWKTGALLEKIPILDHAKSYIVVSSNKMRKEAQKRALANLKKRGRKEHPKKSAKNTPYIADDATPEPPGSIQMEVEVENSPSAADAPVAAEDMTEEDAFVVSKLEYFSTASGLSVLMWSVVGYAH
jgi:tRNA (guanine-N(7)-)-methyltransferase subunit TRM82